MALNTIKKYLQDILGYKIMNKFHLPIGLELETDILYKLKTVPSVIFDVGANTGQTALRFHHYFPGSRIYSFEPVSNTFNVLKKNTAGIQAVKVYHCALGNQNTEQEIQLFPQGQSYLNSLLDNSDLLENNAKKELIRISRTDDFCRENGIDQIDFLKIDTEGYELEVLRGAETMLSGQKIKLIYCETGFSPHNHHKVYFPDLLNHLTNKGYVLFGFYEMGSYESIDLNIQGGSQYGNALFFLP